MSYDISLCKDGEEVIVDKFEEGGTHVLGGTDRASLNITYNYGWFYYRFLDKRKGLRWLYGKTGAECISRLQRAVEILGTDQYTVHERGYDLLDKSIHHMKRIDYWAPTPGNAGHALNILLHWAKSNPDAVFEGD